VRLGGLLALDFASRVQVDSIILWQPFMSGRACINQFLRLRLASQSDAGVTGGPRSTSALRAQLAVQGMIEVAGYEVAVPLVKAIDACDAAHIKLPPCTVHWFAGGADASARAETSAARLGARWAADGVRMHFHRIEPAVPFWCADDIAVCHTLLAATTAVFEGGGA
jgi:hypothetical protein